MKRILIAVSLSLALAGAAHAFGIGMGNRFGKLGAASIGGSVTPPTSTCTSGSLMNGVFDLTNTCNDIYFIGGLK